MRNKKSDYIIETKTIWDLSWNFEITKSWKLESSQDINQTSLASWKVKNILKKEWETVSIWDLVMELSDTYGTYNSMLQKSKINLDSSRINYDSTKINLEKNITDVKTNLDKLNTDYQNALNDSTLTYESINENITETNLENTTSKASMNL